MNLQPTCNQLATDCISRQAALEALCDNCESVDSGCVHNYPCKRYSAIEQLPSARQWIPCSERLPEEGENVLITDEDGYVVEADYTRYSWEDDPIVWYSDGCHVKPVAWMPLPEPYNQEVN